MTDVFISYSHNDEELASELKRRVDAENLVSFLASVSLREGEKWSPNIMTALREAKWIFVLATPDALKSEAVQHEISGAVYGDKNIVPVMVGVTPGDLPFWLSEYQGVVADAANFEAVWDQIGEIISRIRSQKTTGLLIAAALAGFAAYYAFKN
ncbi:MAG: hypothetical protein ACJA0K_000655 [Maricaulis maris]|jgi:hypothetical protein